MRNPILNKEIKIGSRSIKYSVFVMLYNAILVFIALIIMIGIHNSYKYNGVVDVRSLTAVFPVACWLQFILVCVMVPAMCASAISGERERQTLDMMLTTKMTTKEIIFGKLFSSIGIIMTFVISSMPILSLTLIYGGIGWYHLFSLVFLVFIHAILFGTISIYCSVFIKRTVGAIVLSYVLEMLIMIVPFAVWGIFSTISTVFFAGQQGGTPLWLINMADIMLLFNPAISFYQFVQCSIGEAGIEQYISALQTDLYQYRQVEVVNQVKQLALIIRNLFVPCNIIVELIISCIFYNRAAYKLNPIPTKKKRRKSKK